MDLNLVRAFLAVHRTGSFSRAGDQLGVPRSTISRAVSQLEDQLGVTLFQRTTRRVASTSAAARLFDRLEPALRNLEAALEDLPERDQAPTGTLRLTATADFAAIVLAEAVTRFTARYPGVTVDLRLTHAVVDLVRDGVDLAVRFAQQRLSGASLSARKLGSIMFQLYAAPAYLARRGTPREPADIAQHDWIAFRGAASLKLTVASIERAVSANTRASCDDMFVARELLRQGGGIGGLPSFVGDPDVASGALVRVLPRWTASTGSVYLVRPHRKHVPRAVTAFTDILVEMVRQRPFFAPAAG